MKANVSATTQLILMAAIISSTVLILRPDAVELPLPVIARKPIATERKVCTRKDSPLDEKPWVRTSIPDSLLTNPNVQLTADPPPLPPAGAKSDNAMPPPLPPIPSQPAQSDVVYLGRIVKDGNVKVFFASTGEPVILNEGGILNGSWRVTTVSSTHVTLVHLHTGETRSIAMGGTEEQHSHDVATVQVGPRYLAHQSAQPQQPNSRKMDE